MPKHGTSGAKQAKRRGKILRRMTITRPARRRAALPLAVWAVAAAMLAAVLPLAPDAIAQSPFNPYSSFTDSGPVTPEERERRQQVRSDLYDRLSPDYRLGVPLVSADSVAALELAIERYRQIVASGGWPAVPQQVTLRPGDSGSDVAAIRRRLIIEGDLPAGSRRTSTFDNEFLEGLSRYQIRNGLRVSGFVNRRTLAALNIPAQERLAQLESNLVRIKKLMRINKAPRYVLVDIPGFFAQAVDNGALALESNVITGKPSRATPQISAKIVEVNFYPTWSVPRSIAQKDLIPQIRKDPSYFDQEHFSVMVNWKSPPLDPATVDWDSPQVQNYVFRQDPGPFNALGVVRINMPNKHSVYMHDTPLKQLFSQSARAFSSGCVRVQKVQELSAWLLGEQGGWTLAKVEDQIASGKRLNVKLARPVPVHFVYVTAFASGNGIAQFRPDIYGRDAGFGAPDDDADSTVTQQASAVTP